MKLNDATDTAHLAASELLARGSQALEHQDYAAAYRLLHQAVRKERSAEALSQYAIAMAHHIGNVQGAVSLCQEALKSDSRNPELFFRLGTVYLVGGRKKEAIRILQLGLRAGRHAGISRLLQMLGQRREPVLPFLSRSHPLNRYLGKIRAKREAKKRSQLPMH